MPDLGNLSDVVETQDLAAGQMILDVKVLDQ